MIKRLFSLLFAMGLILFTNIQANAFMRDPLEYKKGLDSIYQEESKKANMQLNIHEVYQMNENTSLNIVNIKDITDYTSDLISDKEYKNLDKFIQITYDVNYFNSVPIHYGIQPVGIKANGEKILLVEDDWYSFRNTFIKDVSKPWYKTIRWTTVYEVSKGIESISIKALPIKGGFKYSAGINNDNFWSIKTNEITKDGWNIENNYKEY